MLLDTSLHIGTDTALRVGIIGLGHIGRFHADRLLKQGAVLAGGMDVDPTARTHFAEHYNTAAYDDLNQLFDVADAIVVALALFEVSFTLVNCTRFSGGGCF